MDFLFTIKGNGIMEVMNCLGPVPVVLIAPLTKKQRSVLKNLEKSLVLKM
jgi:hypothetical protein